MITEKEICMELMNLIEKSELRIDRTNKIVAMLAEVSKRISDSYMQHINTLCINRDKMLEQINRLTAMLAEERRRNDALWQHLLTKHSPATNNINVNQ
jgi:hypothetical protein|nr:MAG TPA_asm: hypothetical protein [Caudoviricetes sp.]